MELLKKLELNPNEKIIREIKHHSIIITPHLILSFLIVLFDFFMMYYLFLQGWWGASLFISVLVVTSFYIFRLFFLYGHNKLIITNQRLIDFEQSGFFEKAIYAYKYENIKSAIVLKKNLIAKIFKYGNLKIKTKKDIEPLELYKLPQPELIKAQIEEYLDKIEEVVEKKQNPINLIMQEVELLNQEQKIDLIKQINDSLED